jgi:hypothetical protein
MTSKRHLLAKLGWPKDLIDSFLEEGASDMPAVDGAQATFTVHAYADQSNVMVDIDSAPIQSGMAVTSTKRKNSRAKSPA